jgi:hypothetical protein
MEVYLWSPASLFRSILAHISHSNKPPLEWNLHTQGHFTQDNSQLPPGNDLLYPRRTYRYIGVSIGVPHPPYPSARAATSPRQKSGMSVTTQPQTR